VVGVVLGFLLRDFMKIMKEEPGELEAYSLEEDKL